MGEIAARLVSAFEGCGAPVPGRPGLFQPYRCPAGVLTIGYGHTGALPPAFDSATRWTTARCEAVLAADLARCAAEVDRVVTVPLAPHQRDALISFQFNTGGLARSSIPARLRAGAPEAVAPVLRRWVKARGRVLPGLVRRREAEALVFDGQVEAGLRLATGSAAPSPKRVTRPAPPAAVVAGEGTTATAGAGLALAAARAESLGLAIVAVVITALAIAVLIVRWRRLSRDWA